MGRLSNTIIILLAATAAVSYGAVKGERESRYALPQPLALVGDVASTVTWSRYTYADQESPREWDDSERTDNFTVEFYGDGNLITKSVVFELSLGEPYCIWGDHETNHYLYADVVTIDRKHMAVEDPAELAGLLTPAGDGYCTADFKHPPTGEHCRAVFDAEGQPVAIIYVVCREDKPYEAACFIPHPNVLSVTDFSYENGRLVEAVNTSDDTKMRSTYGYDKRGRRKFQVYTNGHGDTLQYDIFHRGKFINKYELGRYVRYDYSGRPGDFTVTGYYTDDGPGTVFSEYHVRGGKVLSEKDDSFLGIPFESYYLYDTQGRLRSIVYPQLDNRSDLLYDDHGNWNRRRDRVNPGPVYIHTYRHINYKSK